MQKYLLVVARLWKLLKPFHKYLYLQIFLIFTIQLTGTGFTILFSKIIDALISKDADSLITLTSLFPVVAVIATVAAYVADKNEVKNLDATVQQHLEEYSFKRIFNLNAFQYLESHSAIKLQVINRGENAVQTVIQILTLQGLPIIFSLAISLVAISYYSLTIGIWTLFTLCVLLYATNKFNNYFSPLIRKNMDNWDIQRKVRTEAFNHLLLIKLSGQEENYLKKYLARRFDILSYGITIWITNAKYINGRNFVIYASRFVSLLLVITLFMNGEVTVGVVYAIFSWTTDIYNNIRNINGIFRQLPQRFIELEKYLNIIDQEPAFDEQGKHQSANGAIQFNDVTFTYPSSEVPALSSVSFTIEKGKRVAFVGHSGSGKSTITKILLKMYAYQGGLVSINGEDIRSIHTNTLRTSVGYVEQHVDLFDDTLKENILFGVNDCARKTAEEKLEETAKKARIDQFYERLGEARLDALIGERGIKLSGGERQRVGIARAIIKDPEILIFDEATSSLDTENEAKVMEAINEVSKGKTTIIIAHRLSTVRDADKIIVMDKGKVVGEGTHEELMKSNEVYKNLVAHQV